MTSARPTDLPADAMSRMVAGALAHPVLCGVVRVLLAVAACLMVSCTYYSATSTEGAQQRFAQLGGKGAFAADAGGGLPAVAVQWDNEKSFEDANRTINSLGTAYFLAQAAKAMEATKQAASADDAREAVAAGKSAAEVEKARIAADVSKAELAVEEAALGL